MLIKTIKISLFFLVVSFLFLSTAATANADSPPIIKNFSASDTYIEPGDMITIEWDVENAYDIELLGDFGDTFTHEPLSGSKVSFPFITTTYVLNVYGKDMTMNSKTITVYVEYKKIEKDVSIDSFESSKLNIKSGETIKLNYSLSNASNLEIIGLDKSITSNLNLSNDTIEVKPLTTTKYTLIAHGNKKGSSVRTSLLINVEPKPEEVYINAFYPQSDSVDDGKSTKLIWNVSNAKSVKIEGISNELANRGSITIHPKIQNNNYSGYKKYTLVAEDYSGKKISTDANIYVYSLPKSSKILSFYAKSENIKIGESTELVWNVENAKKISIKGDPTKYDPYDHESFSITVSPKESRVYELVTTGYDDKTTTSSLYVNVEPSNEKVEIINFESSSNNITDEFDSVKLSWKTKNADSIKLLISDGNIYNLKTSSGVMSVYPSDYPKSPSKTYTLMAYGNGKAQKSLNIDINLKN